MKRLLLATVLLLPFAARAQMKLGNNPTTIDPASILELEDSTRALYLTRVSLTSTSDVTTVPNPKAGMVVFNTNAAVNSTPNPIYTANGRGVYYFDGTGWVYSGSGGVGLTNFWSLTGNANAVDGVNFLGTTNNVALNFRVFNNKAGRIDLQGNTLLGYLAGNNLTTGINLNNTLIGSGAGSGITSGVNNVGVGSEALQNNGQGFSNVAVGYRAGATYANSNHNTYLGDSTDITTAGINNATAVGAGARVSQSNSVILGNSAASVGIGNTAPTNKLHVTGTDPLRLEGLQGIGSSGVSGTDSVLTTTASGVVKKVGVSSVLQPIKANNGLTRVADSIQLGGSLSKATSITTNGNNLDLFGTGNLNVADSVNAGAVTTGTTLAVGTSATVGTNLTVTNTIKSAADTVSGNTQTGTLDVVNNAVIGNNLRTKSITATGINGGIVTDSVLNITTGGVVRKVSPVALVANAIQADNGVSVGTGTNAGKVVLGGTLNQPTNIATSGYDLSITGNGNLSVTDTINAGTLVAGNVRVTGNDTVLGNTRLNTLTITGLQNGSTADSILTINAAGVVRKISDSASRSAIKANNGLTRVADSIQLGGALTKATFVGTSASNTLALTGLQNGTTADSVLTVGANGVIRKISDSASRSAIKANNGLTRVGDSIQLGGALTKATVVGTSASNTLALTGLQNGTTADSVLTVGANGVIRKISDSASRSAIKANNGLTRVADSIQLGGALTKATTVTTSATNTLALTGLQNGTTADSVLTVGANGVIRKISDSASRSAIKANNGLTRVADSIQLGGALTKATVVGTSATNTLALTGLQNGLRTDSVLTVGPGGIVRKISDSAARSNIKADNGLTRVADSIELGGTLKMATTIATGNNSNTLSITGPGNFNVADTANVGALTVGGNSRVAGTDTVIGGSVAGSYYTAGNTRTSTLTATGITTGSTADSILTINAAGVVRKISDSASRSAIKANNGLTRVADSIQLGGALTKATTVTTSATNTLALTGLQNGTTADSVLTVGANGVIRKISDSASRSAIKANNGLTRVADSIQLGGALTKATVVGTSATNTLALTGLQNGTTADSVLTVGANGVIRKISDSASRSAIKANNGLTRVADSIQLGGALTKATVVGTSATNTLALTGLQNGTTADSVLTVGANGVIRKISDSAARSNIKANNGLTRVADSIQLGGALTKATVVGTSASNTLALTGLQNGTATDSFLTIGANGVIRKISDSAARSNIKANNGLTRLADSIQLGGALTKATTIGTSVTNTLAVTGLQPGTVTDSLVTINTTNGQLRRVDINTTGAVTNAGNGLRKVGNTIILGGKLDSSTTINTGINNLTIGGPLSSGGVSISNKLDAGELQVLSLSTLNNTNVNGFLNANGSFVANGNIINLNSGTGNVTINNLANGAITDSVLTLDVANGNKVRKVNVNTLGVITSANNGLTKTGNTVQLGGTLLKPTTIGTVADSNTLSITGPGNFNVADTANVGALTSGNAYVTGTLRVTGSDTIGSNITAGGNSYVGGNSRVVGNDTVGGNITSGAAIYAAGNTNTNTLTARDLASGSVLDSIVTINNATGVVNKRNVNDVLAAIKANNGLTRVADSIQLGGALTKATTVTTSATNTLALAGLQNGTATDSFLTIGANGVIRKISDSAARSNIKANNGLTRVADSIQLGGALTKATTVTTSATNTLALAGLQNGTTADSVLTVSANGVIRKISDSAARSNIKANNGLTRVADSIQLGGNLTKATVVGTSTANTLALTGLQNGTATDSVLTVGANGVIRKISDSAARSNIKANNGLTRVADSIQLGGTLTKATTINTDSMNTLTIQANGVGGAGNDANQGLTVIATTKATSASNRAIGTRSSLVVMPGTTANEARAVSGTTNVYGNITGTATGAYLNTILRPGSNLASGATVTGASGDVEVINGTTNLDNTRTLTGARFGADATNGAVARTTGVTATAVGSTSSNVGVAAGANLSQAQVKAAIAAQPTGFSAGVMAVNGANGANDRALYTSGTVQLAGLQNGTTSDSILTVSSGGIVRMISDSASRSRIKANNGLTRLADSIQLGGALTKATTVTTSATNTLALTGLQNGLRTDSVLTVGPGGVIRKISDSAARSSIKADNGLTRVADSIELGGTLKMATTIATGNNGNTLSITGPGNFNVADTANVGALTVGGNSRVAGTDTVIGGSVAGSYYTAGNTRTSTLTATDLTTGTTSDSVLTVGPGGIVRKISDSASRSRIKADNGLTRVADSIELGGTLKMATTIATSAANTLALTGLQNGLRTDSVLTVGPGGVVRKISDSAARSSIKADNGLTRVADSIELGGTLKMATTIATSAANTLALTGLQNGTATDSFLTVGANGVIRKISDSAARSNIKANNGLTRVADSIQLGGTLTKATTINTDSMNTLTIQANGVGGAGNDANQGLTVIATTKATSASNRAIGTRSSLVVMPGTTANEARAVSGTTNVYGNITGTATGAYLNTILRPGSNLASGATVTGASGDVEVINGTTNLDNTRTLTGARFGADATNGAVARTTGVTATAVGSTSSNVGVAAGANLSEAQVKAAIAAQPTGFSAGVMAVNGANGANDRALYTSGTVQLAGLQNGTTSDSILTVSSGGIVRMISDSASRSRIKANNGLTRLADSIQLGGALTKATTVTTSATNTLALTGLQNGLRTDSVLTVGPGGVIRKISDSAARSSIKADNGLTRVADSIELGGTLKMATTIATGNNGNTLSITGPGNFNVADTANVGALTVGGNSRVAGNDTVIGGSVAGSYYTAGNTRTSTLTATDLTTGTTSDSVLTVGPGGIVRKISDSASRSRIKADNGLTRVADSIELGGTLKMATTIATSAANTLALTGLQNGLRTDSVLTVGPGGVIRKISDSAARSSIKADNGLTRVADSIELGGTLKMATTIATSAANTLALTGLQNGTATDSFLTVGANGVIRKISDSAARSNIKANNGLTRVADSIQLGGTLTKNTVIGTSSNNYTLTLGGPGGGTGALLVSGTISAGNNINAANDISASGNANITAQTTTGTLKINITNSAQPTDSILTIDPLTRLVKNRTVASFASLAGSGLTNNTTTGKIDLGGTLTTPATIATAGNDLSLTGTGNLNVSDTINAGALNVTTGARIGGNTRVAGNDTVIGGSVAGSYYTAGNTRTSTLTATDLTTGTTSDSVLTVGPGGIVRKISDSASRSRIKADNGLTRVADSIELGGTLKMATTIATAGNDLSLTGTGNLNVADTINAGALNVTTGARIGGNTRVAGTDTVIGGSVAGSYYTAGNTRTSTLTATDLTTGTTSDSVLTVGPGGIVRKISDSAARSNIKANNGLTRVADSIQLGGTLTKNTTIDQNDKQLQFTNVDRFAINSSTTLDSERFVVRADGTIAMGNAPAIYPTNKVEVNLQGVGGAMTSGEENQGVNVLASALNGSAQSTALRARMNVNTGSTVGTARGLQGNVGIDGTLNGGASGGYFNAVVRSGATMGANATVSAVSGDAEATSGAPTGAATNYFIGGRLGANVAASPNANSVGVFGTATGATNTTSSNTGVLAAAFPTGNTNTGLAAGVGAFPGVVADITAAKANKSAAIVGVNRGVGDSTYAGYFIGSNSSKAGRVLAVRNDITATMTTAVSPAALDADLTYNPASTPIGAGIKGITTAAHSRATTTANDYQAQGSLMEAAATNGENTNGQFHAIGGLGLGVGLSSSGTRDANATVVGLSGGTDFPGTGADWNGVGVDGFVDFSFNGTTGRLAGGHFDGTSSAAPGTSTAFGMIGTVGGGLYQTFFDPSLANRNIGVAATNNNLTAGDGDSTQLALYSSGAVQMVGLNGTGTNLVTIDQNGLVGTAGAMLSGSAALDFGTVIIGAGATYDQTFTVTGAQDGDVVSLGVPTSAMTSQGIYTAFVSAADTITVRLTNTSGTSIPTGSRAGTFKVKVMQ